LILLYNSNVGGESTVDLPNNLNPKLPPKVQQLLKIPGNDKCADCSSPEPTWASVNLGVLVCISCSGAHRSLGVHISKIRSLTLDSWISNETSLDVIKNIGNQKANAIWEQEAPLHTKPNPNDPFDVKEHWVKAKYKEKAFIERPTKNPQTLSKELCHYIKQNIFDQVVHSLVLGADLNWADVDDKHKSCIHIAATNTDPIYIEYLLQNGANLNGMDDNKWNALFYAASTNNAAAIELLVKRGLSLHSLDKGQNKPFIVALEHKCEDAAILLKMLEASEQDFITF